MLSDDEGARMTGRELARSSWSSLAREVARRTGDDRVGTCTGCTHLHALDLARIEDAYGQVQACKLWTVIDFESGEGRSALPRSAGAISACSLPLASDMQDGRDSHEGVGEVSYEEPRTGALTQEHGGCGTPQFVAHVRSSVRRSRYHAHDDAVDGGIGAQGEPSHALTSVHALIDAHRSGASLALQQLPSCMSPHEYAAPDRKASP